MGVWGWDETGKATGFTGSCALCHHLAQPQCSAWQVISFSNIRKPRQQNSWGFTKDSRLCCVAGMAGPSGCLPPLSPRREGTPELPAPLVTHTPDKPTKSLPPTTALYPMPVLLLEHTCHPHPQNCRHHPSRWSCCRRLDSPRHAPGPGPSPSRKEQAVKRHRL